MRTNILDVMRPMLSITFTLTAILSSTIAFSMGTKDGGGGSKEAKNFTALAVRAAHRIVNETDQKAFGKQLLETLGPNNKLEINLVDSLYGLCDGKAQANDLAYSCKGQVNLLSSIWLQWLSSEAAGQEQIQQILHETARAADPSSQLFVTNDGAYVMTTNIFLRYNMGPIFSNSNGNPSIGGDCPIDGSKLQQRIQKEIPPLIIKEFAKKGVYFKDPSPEIPVTYNYEKRGVSYYHTISVGSVKLETTTNQIIEISGWMMAFSMVTKIVSDGFNPDGSGNNLRCEYLAFWKDYSQSEKAIGLTPLKIKGINNATGVVVLNMLITKAFELYPIKH